MALRPPTLRRRNGHETHALALEAATVSTRTAFDGIPGRVVTVAGLHGGAGATTVALHLATAATAGRGRPLVIDLAGSSAGGLAVLAGAATSAPPTTLAALRKVPNGTSRIRNGLAQTTAGVAVMGALPRADTFVDHYAAGALARFGEKARSGATADEIAELVHTVAETRLAELTPWGSGAAEQLAELIAGARQRFGLVVVDLGMAVEPDVTAAIANADLHLWVTALGPVHLQRATHQLAAHPFRPAREAIVVRDDNSGTQPDRHQYMTLIGERAAPIVQMPHHGPADDGVGPQVARTLGALASICDLVPR
jgi:Mrp family chromosome partitioning ATPase